MVRPEHSITLGIIIRWGLIQVEVISLVVLVKPDLKGPRQLSTP